MASTPQAMPTSMASAAIRLAMKWLACWAEPHWQSTVVAADSYGSPALSQALRVTFEACSPAWVTQPPDDLLDRGGIDAGPLDQLDLGGGQQLGGVQAREPAVALADRRADGLDDDRLTHVLLPGWMTAPNSRIRSSFPPK